MTLVRYSLGYWLRLEKIDLIVASLLLLGETPEWEDSDQPDEGPVISAHSLFWNCGAEAEAFHDLLKSAFPNEQVSPRELLSWAFTRKLQIPAPLMEEARTLGLLEENSLSIGDCERTSAADDRGGHWAEKRQAILEAALQVIDTSKGEVRQKIYRKYNGEERLNANGLAEIIHDNRHRWPRLKEEIRGTSLKNIAETIRDVLKVNIDA